MVTLGNPSYAGADGLHHARAFVATDDGQARFGVTKSEVLVRVAKSRSHHP
jgi:hypothetical protein